MEIDSDATLILGFVMPNPIRLGIDRYHWQIINEPFDSYDENGYLLKDFTIEVKHAWDINGDPLQITQYLGIGNMTIYQDFVRDSATKNGVVSSGQYYIYSPVAKSMDGGIRVASWEEDVEEYDDSYLMHDTNRVATYTFNGAARTSMHTKYATLYMTMAASEPVGYTHIMNVFGEMSRENYQTVMGREYIPRKFSQPVDLRPISIVTSFGMELPPKKQDAFDTILDTTSY